MLSRNEIELRIRARQRGRSKRRSWKSTGMSLLTILVAVAALFVLIPAPVTAQQKSVDPSETTVIGIDLGTTYSCVGVYKAGIGVEIIPNHQGNRITPSYVAFTDNNERLVGDSAKNQATLNPQNTIFDVKRLIGREYSDESVQSDKKLVPYNIVSKANKPMIQVNNSD